jgi:uncharacterized protein YkwD
MGFLDAPWEDATVRHLFWIVPCLIALSSLPLALADGKDDSKDIKLSEDEQTIFDLTNKAREEEKLPPLKLNPLLTRIARAHSANMAKQGKLSHELDGKNPSQRMKDAGYAASWGGENVADNDGDTATSTFQMWMESKAHKENILKDKYKEIGVGVARNAKGKVYYTQVFGTRKQR